MRVSICGHGSVVRKTGRVHAPLLRYPHSSALNPLGGNPLEMGVRILANYNPVSSGTVKAAILVHIWPAALA
jgi:hypothetical protein